MPSSSFLLLCGTVYFKSLSIKLGGDNDLYPHSHHQLSGFPFSLRLSKEVKMWGLTKREGGKEKCG